MSLAAGHNLLRRPGITINRSTRWRWVDEDGRVEKVHQPMNVIHEDLLCPVPRLDDASKKKNNPVVVY